MNDDQIIAIRKATREHDVTKPWGDSIAFARAILLADAKDRRELTRLELTHECVGCAHRYTPMPEQSEDCPVCGCDGTTPSHQESSSAAEPSAGAA